MALLRSCFLVVLPVVTGCCQGYIPPTPPPISPATNLPNQLYKWKQNQQIRYQTAGKDGGHPVLLVHGLFVNSDHWRKTLKDLAADGYKAYALDLWGCGYSSKPPRDSFEARVVNGENGRFISDDDDEDDTIETVADGNKPTPSILRNIPLGTSSGIGTRIVDVELKHPLGSPYNFYTWSELVSDFCRDVIHSDEQVTLVCNSIGTSSSLQAVIDEPDLYRGVFVISPNFRELHSAEVPRPDWTMPIIRSVQKALRKRGQPLFDALAKPNVVKKILMEPYKVREAVDDTLVKVLLDPLLTEGASDVVFDMLAYSAGPLPEQQLAAMPANKPVWVCYGKSDPWTPCGRVEALANIEAVEKVVGWDGVGHCPHDEAPELVQPFLRKFLNRIGAGSATTTGVKDTTSGRSSLFNSTTAFVR